MHTSPVSRSDTRSLGAVMTGLEATRARIAALQAEELQLLARADAIAAERTARVPSASGREREMPLREIAAEAAAVLRRSDRGMTQRLHDATALVTGFPATVASLRAGRIDTGHVRVIHDAGHRIGDPDARARFEQAALVVCERETPGRARPIVAVIAQRFHPVPIEDRHADAVGQRRVWVRDLDEGMAELAAVLPATLAYAIRDRLTQYARHITTANTRSRAHRDARADVGGEDAAAPQVEPEARPETESDVPATDSRTTDQIRADVFTDLLLTGHAAAPRSAGTVPEGSVITAHVQILIPVDALTRTSTAPAVLAGYGPIDPETARTLAASAEIWERVFTSPTTGAVEHVDTYRPSRAQRRHLDARDEHCRFPGCRRPARRCDHDHTHDAARGGPTALNNLANLCARHHTLKHATAWTVVQKAHGILEWTSPTGRVHPDIPHRVLEFSALTAAAATPPATAPATAPAPAPAPF